MGAEITWFAELTERKHTHKNTDSNPQNKLLHHTVVASVSGVNVPCAPVNTSRIDATSTYVQNAINGMYKSGALISFLGGLYPVPPATLSGSRAQEPLCKNGHITNRNLWNTYDSVTSKYARIDAVLKYFA
jgi:hypothetical protein